jgi:hypothetical protein
VTSSGYGEEAAPRGAAYVRPYLGTPQTTIGAAEPAQVTGPRPFILTSGRVDVVDPSIGLETQVTARPSDPGHERPPTSTLAPALQAIIELCQQPISVAEISARLRLHFGVARILVGDLRVAGYLDVHVRDVEASHDPDSILRVIRGLRAIA